VAFSVQCRHRTVTDCSELFTPNDQISQQGLSVARKYVIYEHINHIITGPTVWNSLPDFIRDPSISTDTFRRLLKTYLREIVKMTTRWIIVYRLPAESVVERDDLPPPYTARPEIRPPACPKSKLYNSPDVFHEFDRRAVKVRYISSTHASTSTTVSLITVSASEIFGDWNRRPQTVVGLYDCLWSSVSVEKKISDALTVISEIVVDVDASCVLLR